MIFIGILAAGLVLGWVVAVVVWLTLSWWSRRGA